MPSVLFINRVFPPDDGATGQLLAELAEGLVREGWTVTVLAAGQGSEPRTSGSRGQAETKTETHNPKPGPPASGPASVGRDSVEPSHVQNSGFKVQSSMFDVHSVEPSKAQPSVHRVRGLPFTRASLLRRALSYASLYPALFWRALRLPRPDVVVTLTDPPLLLVLGPWLKWFKRAHLVHWAQDVYPEVAEELGVLARGGFAAGLLRFLSTWSLRRHDHIITVGRCMKARLEARGLDGNKITVIPNWAVGAPATSLPKNRSAEHCSARGEKALPPAEQCSALQAGSVVQPSCSPAISPLSPLTSPLPFTVMYSGNFGLAHPFESIIEAVKLLEQERAPVRFVFAGGGPKLDAVRQQLGGCRNVEFRGPASVTELPGSLAAADAHLACMNEALCGLVVPSKVYGAIAAGRPCLFLGPAGSEAAQFITTHRCGLVLPAARSARALADAILLWSTRGPDYQEARRQSEQAAPEAARLPLREFLAALPPIRSASVLARS